MSYKKYIFIKMLFAFIISLFLAVSLGITANAEDYEDDINETIESIEESIESLEGSDENVTESTFEKVFETLDSVGNFGWHLIKKILISDSYSEISDNYSEVIGVISAVFTILGGALVSLFFAINVQSAQIKYINLTQKIVIELLIVLFISIFFMSYSGKICALIYQVNSSLVNALLSGTESELIFMPYNNNVYPEGSNAFGIQYMLDFLNSFFAILPQLLISIIMVVISMIAAIKLSIRKIECVCLMSISPLFFSCIGNERTKRYFVNFLLNYINVVFETTFIALVYIAGLNWWNSTSTQLGTLSVAEWLQELVLLIAICVMIISPPRVLRSAINA